MEDTPRDQETKGKSNKSTGREDGGPSSGTTAYISSVNNSSVMTLIKYEIDESIEIKEEILETKSEWSKSTGRQDAGPSSCATTNISSVNNFGARALIGYDFDESLYIKQEIFQDELHQQGKLNLSGQNQLNEKCLTTLISSDNNSDAKTLGEHNFFEVLDIKEEVLEDEDHQWGKGNFQLNEKSLSTEISSNNDYDQTLQIKEETIQDQENTYQEPDENESKFCPVDTREAIMTVQNPQISKKKKLNDSDAELKKKYSCEKCARRYVRREDEGSAIRNREFGSRLRMGANSTKSRDPLEVVRSEKSCIHSSRVSHASPSVCTETGHSLSKDSSEHLSKAPSLNSKDETSDENVKDSMSYESTEHSQSSQVADVDSTDKEPGDERVKKDKENAALCPLCFEVVGHFPRHLSRQHGDNEAVKKMVSLPRNSKAKRNAILALRKEGYFVLMQQKNVLKPVRSSNQISGENQQETLNSDNYPICVYCLGFFAKSYLWRHRKICPSRTENSSVSRNHLSESQTFLVATGMLGNYLSKSRLRGEVLDGMRPDEISKAAKKDPLICLYGEFYLNKDKKTQMRDTISNKMREMARLKLALQKTITFESLIDVLRPSTYNEIVASVKTISGYNPELKTFRAASFCLHMRTNLNHLCTVAKRALIRKDPLFGIKDSTDIRVLTEEIDNFKEMVKSQWCSDVCIANKVSSENLKPKILHLTEDIKRFNAYVTSSAKDAFEKLRGENLEDNYKLLAECTLALTLIFNRKRIGRVQFLEVETYSRESGRVTEQVIDSLTNLEKALYSSFKIVVVLGKGSKAVPILFTKQMQMFVDAMLDIRKTRNIVPKSNKYLFARPGSKKRSMNKDLVIRKLATKSGTKSPEYLTSTKFRAEIATILQLMHFEKNEIDQMAKFMGHREKTSMEFYRIPEDVYQTAKVAKVLLLMDAGKGEEYRGKPLEEIQLAENDCCVDFNGEAREESEEKNDLEDKGSFQERLSSVESQDSDLEKKWRLSKSQGEKFQDKFATAPIKKQSKRVGWLKEQKQVVLQHFKEHIMQKKLPKKNECLALIAKSGEILKGVNWSRIKILVYNSYREKGKHL